MKQKTIDFRELLERVLPLDELPSADRLHVQRALRTGVASQIERAALHALERLERGGAVRRLDEKENGGGPALRYQARDAFDLFTIRLQAPIEREGVVVVPRAVLPNGAQADLDQVRRLLRLDDTLVFSDPGPEAGIPGPGHPGLLEQLGDAAREFLGASAVRFVTAGALDPDAAVDAALIEEVRARPDAVFYVPDTARAPRLAAEAARREVRALALAGVSGAAGESYGHLEVASRERHPFRPQDLAMVALLSDYCLGVLERAARIEKLVFVDPLTSAYNRSYFDLQLGNEMARAQREQTSMALCIADIDDFKSFNTAYGYEAGNAVLVQVAHTLRRGVRPFDTVARWGGEEFGVLLTSPVAADDVLTVCERLRSLVERQTVHLEGLDRRAHRVGVTVSIGVALFPDHAPTAQDLWRAANRALLEAKRAPKNQVVFYRG